MLSKAEMSLHYKLEEAKFQHYLCSVFSKNFLPPEVHSKRNPDVSPLLFYTTHCGTLPHKRFWDYKIQTSIVWKSLISPGLLLWIRWLFQIGQVRCACWKSMGSVGLLHQRSKHAAEVDGQNLLKMTKSMRYGPAWLYLGPSNLYLMYQWMNSILCG